MRRSLFFITVLLLTIQVTFAQKAKYHSEIMYRLSKQVKWPEGKNCNKFVVGVIGNIEDYKTLQAFAVSKGDFENKPIEVRYYECTDEIKVCDIIYLSDECKIDINQIVANTKNNPILIVSGKEGYGKSGSIINFVENDGKLTFELNESEAEERGLAISEGLRKLAILI